MIQPKHLQLVFKNCQAVSLLLLMCISPFSAERGLSFQGGMSLKLIREFKGSALLDVSPDGRLVLLYSSSKPVRTFTLRPGEGVKANDPEPEDDALRVVELQGGREVARVGTRFFPSDMQFVPATTRVFYMEPGAAGRGWVFAIWNFATGEKKICSEYDALNFRHATLVDSNRAIGSVLQPNGGELLGSFRLGDCGTELGAAVGAVDKPQLVLSTLSVSPDRRYFAYVTGSEIYIRESSTFAVVQKIKANSGVSFGDSPVFTPDGRFLLIVASHYTYKTREVSILVQMFDTADYRFVRQLDISGVITSPVASDDIVSASLRVSAIAVSPDSKLLAVGYTKSGKEGLFKTKIEQGQIALLDMQSGTTLAAASHPAVREKRSDPFLAKVSRLSFTRDGKYLMSSTHDTMVWEILR